MTFKSIFRLLEFLIQYFSRKNIGKLLLKLPATFFPNYRIILRPVILENNGKPRRLTVYQMASSDTEESDEHESYCNCDSTYCRVSSENWRALKHVSRRKLMVSNSDEVVTSVGTPMAPAVGKIEIRKNIFENHPFVTPPLRKITVEELSSVKLRKSVNFPVSPRSPVVPDIIGVLRKRFIVMHSPNMFSRNPDVGEDSDNSLKPNSFCE